MALKGVPPELYKASTGKGVNKFQSGSLHEIVATVGQMEAQKTKFEAIIEEKDTELSIMDNVIDVYRGFIEQFEDVLSKDSKDIQEIADNLELKFKKNTSDKEKLVKIFLSMRNSMIESEPVENESESTISEENDNSEIE